MTEPKAADDPRLWALAYIDFFVRDEDPKCRQCRRDLESDARYMAKAVAVFAVVLMDSVWLRVHYGVDETTPWWEVESLRRTNPHFAAELLRRRSYERIALGWTVLPRRRLRQMAADVVGMLWLAYQAEAGSDASLLHGSDAVVKQLQKYRERFGHSCDVP